MEIQLSYLPQRLGNFHTLKEHVSRTGKKNINLLVDKKLTSSVWWFSRIAQIVLVVAQRVALRQWT